MEARAVTRYVRVSPRKARIVLDQIRGKNVVKAQEILRFTNRAVAEIIEKTLNSAADATSPHADEYWYNLATGEVERGQQSAVTSLWGPFKTYEEAAHAMDRARERNDACEKDGGLL